MLDHLETVRDMKMSMSRFANGGMEGEGISTAVEIGKISIFFKIFKIFLTAYIVSLLNKSFDHPCVFYNVT